MGLADDSMAIMMAFQMASLEILGLTTVFGNVSTQDATNNALLLVCFFYLTGHVFFIVCVVCMISYHF